MTCLLDSLPGKQETLEEKDDYIEGITITNRTVFW